VPPQPTGLPDSDNVAGEPTSWHQRDLHPLLPVLPCQRLRLVTEIAVDKAGQAAMGEKSNLGANNLSV
jgi:hypothetical protein